MFEWLFPSSCPCDRAAKAWIEGRLQWLSGEFDDHAFNGRRVVLPTQEFFPDRFDGSERSVRELLDRVCGYMDVAPDLVEVSLFSNAQRIWLVNESGQYLPQTAGTYQKVEDKFNIRLDESDLGNPMGLVGTMAHELAHVRLLGENRLSRDEFDNELLTDLTTVFFGLGIFLANSPRAWTSRCTKWPGTDLIKPEYMSRPMYGYALAHLAWFQGETKPAWARHLHINCAARLQARDSLPISDRRIGFQARAFPGVACGTDSHARQRRVICFQISCFIGEQSPPAVDRKTCPGDEIVVDEMQHRLDDVFRPAFAFEQRSPNCAASLGLRQISRK